VGGGWWVVGGGWWVVGGGWWVVGGYVHAKKDYEQDEYQYSEAQGPAVLGPHVHALQQGRHQGSWGAHSSLRSHNAANTTEGPKPDTEHARNHEENASDCSYARAVGA
jgi:hypothetical protein